MKRFLVMFFIIALLASIFMAASPVNAAGTAPADASAAPSEGGPRGADALERLRKGESVEWDMPNYVPGEVLVKFKAGVSGRQQEEASDAAGAVSTQRVTMPQSKDNVQLLKLEPGTNMAEALLDLRLNPNVESADLNYVVKLDYTPPSSDFTNQWGLENNGQAINGQAGVPFSDIDATEAWDIERGDSRPVTVAVIDSGIDMNHPGLQNKLWTNTWEFPNNDVDEDNNGVVDDYHGANPTGLGNFWTTTANSFGTSYDSLQYAQSFTAQAEPGDTYELTYVETIHTKIKDPETDEFPDYDILVSVKAELDGPDLASYTITADEVNEYPNLTWIVKDLSQPVICQAGSTYYIVYTVVTDHPHAACYTIHNNLLANDKDVYREGCAWRYIDGEWVSLGYVDMHFDTNGNYYPHDLNGHGTHCAGIICGGDGNSGPVGVAFGNNVKVMPIKVSDCNGYMETHQIVWAIDYARTMGANVISMSLGGTGASPLMEQAVTNVWQAGRTVFAAAGNDSGPWINYPAGYDHVIGVGATNNRDEHADFSNYNQSVDISAPGVDYFSTLPSYPVCLNSYGLPQVAGFMSGTSMATPCAAGVAALMLSHDPSLLPDQIESRLEDTAEDLGDPGRDDYFGWGRINACGALGGVPTPVLVSVSPSSGTPGSRAMLTVKRVDTDRTDIRVYIDGIEANIIGILQNEITIEIPGGLSEGGHTVIVEVGGKRSRGHTFVVVNCAVVMVEPSFGSRGQTLDVDMVGSGTHFRNGDSRAVFEPADGITVNSTTVNDTMHARANITIAPNAPTGWRSVTVLTEGEIPASLPDAFEVREARVHSVSPAGSYRGETHDVSIAGTNTHFSSGDSQVVFEPADGITVNSVAVTDSTHVTANITVSQEAQIGYRNVNVVTNGEVPTPRSPGFNIYNPRITSASPDGGYRGDTLDVNIVGRGTGFSNGVSRATFSGNGITVNSTTVTDSNHAVANITVSPTASTGSRDVNVVTESETPDCLSRGLEVWLPFIQGIQPDTLHTGRTAEMRVTGAGTHFETGVSRAVFEPEDGITVNSTAVTDATHATINLTLSGDAPIQAREFNLVTADEVPSSRYVYVRKSWIAEVSPCQAYRSQTLDVLVVGAETAFTEGKSRVAIEPAEGTTVNSTTVADATHATANITVSADAALGTRNLTVVTGDETTHPYNFDVYGCYIKSVGPDTAFGGGTLDVAIEGSLTHFASGTSRATFSGSGITINSTTVTDATHAVANITISTTATECARDVTVVTGDETPNAAWFYVRRPFVKSATPAIGGSGQTMDVWIWGESTHFQDGRSWAWFSGDGITVNSTTVSDATHAVANITISPTASEGQREVRMITGEEATEPGTFSVTATPSPDLPSLISITPDRGTQGETVDITNLAGVNFDKGGGIFEVKLRKAGYMDITAVNVNVISGTQINCTLDLAYALPGTWDVYVRNRNNENVTKAACFAVDPAAEPVPVPEPEPEPEPEPPSSEPRPEPGPQPVQATPAVSGVVPETGPPGTEVTISGSGFGSSPGGTQAGTGASSYVSFNGAAATRYSRWTDTEIVCTVPEGASPGPVTVVKGGVSSEGGKTFTVSAPAWYLPEGSTAHGFTTYISIENPNSSEVTCRVTYMTEAGPRPIADVALPPESQLTLNPEGDLGEADFSTKIECTDPAKTIAVDRTITWRGEGASSSEAHSSVGVNLPAKTWYLPEGSSAWGFETWLLLMNPGSSEATCRVTYMIEGGGPRTVEHKVPAGSRKSFNMETDLGGGADASIKVESDVPIIPERAMYRNDRREGHDSIGTTSPANDYYLAEGTTAHGFVTYVLVQNPGEAAAAVSLTYMTNSGPKEQPPFTMPAGSRKTVRVNDVLPDADLSVRVHSDKPIIAERAMYWRGGPDSSEACHDSIGMAQPHSCFYLPDGQVSGGCETYTLVMNPNDTEVEVEVSYLTPTGKGNVVFAERIPAGSRKTYNMVDRIPSGRAAVRVICKTAGRKIMVERSMYWNSRGAGTDTIGGYSD